jgi:glycosyltransferase involved in cell wall biosynthesis
MSLEFFYQKENLMYSAKLSFGFELEGKPFPIIPKFDPYRLIAKIFEPIYVANSDHGRKIMSMKRRLKLEQIKVIRNTYVPREKVLNNEIWKKCLKKEKNSKIVTMIANFFNPKDHITVIKAWSKLDKKHNAKLVFAGKGRVKDCLKNYHNATSLVESLHLQDSVYFLDEVEDVNSLLSITDVGLLSSRSEGCPNVLLEYMGAHLPIIGTDIPGIQEIIPDIQKQYLFEVGDIEECAKKINFLLSNKLEAEVAGKKNYEYLLKNFYNNDMYEHYTTILKSKGIVA